MPSRREPAGTVHEARGGPRQQRPTGGRPARPQPTGPRRPRTGGKRRHARADRTALLAELQTAIRRDDRNAIARLEQRLDNAMTNAGAHPDLPSIDGGLKPPTRRQRRALRALGQPIPATLREASAVLTALQRQQ